MAHPNHSDTIIAIYQAAMRPEFWAETLDLVADYLGVDSGMVLHLGSSRGGPASSKRWR